MGIAQQAGGALGAVGSLDSAPKHAGVFASHWELWVFGEKPEYPGLMVSAQWTWETQWGKMQSRLCSGPDRQGAVLHVAAMGTGASSWTSAWGGGLPEVVFWPG